MKIVAVLVAIVIALSGVCGFLFYQNSAIQSKNIVLENQIIELESQVDELELQNSELETQLIEQEVPFNLVRITEFTATGHGIMTGGMRVNCTANVTVQNFGVNDVNGLTLEIQYNLAVGTAPTTVVNLGFLAAEKTRNINTQVTGYVGGGTFDVKLLMNSNTMHEHTYPFGY